MSFKQATKDSIFFIKTHLFIEKTTSISIIDLSYSIFFYIFDKKEDQSLEE